MYKNDYTIFSGITALAQKSSDWSKISCYFVRIGIRLYFSSQFRNLIFMLLSL